MPQNRGGKLTNEQKRVAHLLYAFKDGRAPALVAKLMSLAVRRERSIIDKGENLTCSYSGIKRG